MNSITLAIVVGTLSSAIATFYAVRKISQSRWRLKEGSDGVLSRRVAWTLGFITFPFAWFLGFIFGGNFGGGIASKFSEQQGISEAVLVPIGIGTGIFASVALLSIGVSFIAFVLARIITHR